MNFDPVKPLPSPDGDIKLSRLQVLENEFFKYDRFPDQGNQDQHQFSSPDLLSVQGSEKFKKHPFEGEGFLCHHPRLDEISATEIRIALANHTAAYTRSLLCSISQIAYHLCRQSIAGITSASQLSGLLAARMLPILSVVRYSCHWAEKQMRRWWGREMSATTFRRIRADLESWGCFTVDRVAPGSTRKVTPLRGVNLPRLLEIASFAFQRLCDEPDGWDRFMPGHRCGFLASLWKLFFPGTFYAPDKPMPYRNPELEIVNKQTELLKVRSLAQEHAWSEFLVSHYREQEDLIQRQIRNLETFLLAQEVAA